MRYRIPIPLKQLLKDKQSEKLKEQFIDQNQAGNQGDSKSQNQAQNQNQNQSQDQNLNQNQSQDQAQIQNQNQSQDQNLNQNQSQGQAQIQNQNQSQDQNLNQNQSQDQAQIQDQNQSQDQNLNKNQSQDQAQIQNQNQSQDQNLNQNQSQDQAQTQNQSQSQNQDQKPNQNQSQGQTQTQNQSQSQNQDQNPNQNQSQDQAQIQNQSQSQNQNPNQNQSQGQAQIQNQSQSQNQNPNQNQNQAQNQKQGKSQGRPKVQIKLKNQNQNQNQSSQPQQPSNLYSELKQNLDHIKKSLGNSSDIVTRNFLAGKNGEIKLGIVYTDGLTDIPLVQDFILDTLMIEIRNTDLDSKVVNASNIFDLIKSHLLPVGEVKEISDFQKLFLHVLSGDTMLLIDGFSKGMVLSSRDWADRGVQEPSSQTVVRGPKDGFSETLRTNTALIRRRIKDPNLWLETKQIGKKTQTDVAIMYLKGVVNDKTVAELQSRLNRINIDAILESGYIEELIQDEVYTPFPTVYNTERPDTVAAGILEGRIAILVDGTPFVLLVPALLVHFFQSSEDYYQRADIATLIRMLRYLTFFFSLLTPSFYVAITTFHQEMLPTPLLISLASQREGVPFPALVEALLMEMTFEILREAGVRLPKAVGSAISIVGALVIGQSAVDAGIVSASMVIVVSFTAICSFVTPSFNMAISVRILRFLFMGLAATFGLFGIILGLIVLVLHLNSVRSFGIPYLAPNAPFIWQDQKDNILRLPQWALFSRPRLISQKDVNRDETPSPKPSR